MQVLCVALGAAAPCLLGYGVMQGAARRVPFALAALLAGVATLALSFALTWGPASAWGWLRAPQIGGLAGGALMALLALPLPQRACLALLAVALGAQLWLLNEAFFFRIFGFFRQYRWFGMPKQRVGFVGRRSLTAVFMEKQQCH